MKKLTIEYIKQVAASRDGYCLSSEYKINTQQLQWQCKNGHIWETNFHNINRGSWCTKCDRITLQDCINSAAINNGLCLSAQYISCRKNLIWQCKEGHIWEAAYSHIKQGTWCQKCGYIARRNTLDRAHFLALQNNGKCLSIKYENSHKKLIWECENKHIWEAPLCSIQTSKTWCAECNGTKKLTLQICIELAKSKNGKCLSDEYFNSNTKMLWECQNKHQWSARYKDIKYKDSWCPICNDTKLSLDDCHKFADANGGKCISNEYKNNYEHLEWQCKNGHTWSAAFSNKTWCPECVENTSKAQYFIFEQLKKNFPNYKIVLNDKKIIKPKELDIYIPSLKIGIEYDGEYWHYSDWAIKQKNSLEKMKVKEQLCNNAKIKLIRIRENDWIANKDLELNKLINFIKSKILLIIDPK